MAVNHVDFSLRPLPGEEILVQIAQALREEYADQSVTIVVDTNFQDQHFRHEKIPLANFEEHKVVVSVLTELRRHSHLTCTKIEVAVEGQHCSVCYTTDGSVVATLKLTNVQQIGAGKALQITDALAKTVQFTTRNRIIAEDLPDFVREGIEHREVATEELIAAVTRLGTLGAEAQQKNDDFLREKVTQVDKRFETKETQLEETYGKKEEAFIKRKEAFAAKEAEFETRESKYMRRKLLEKIQELIKAQKVIKLSSATSRKRWVNHVVCAVAMTGGALLAYVFAAKLLAAQQAGWRDFVPITGGMILFASTLIFYIKWNNAWSKEHADIEFRNMRFSADILRANWLGELVLEWQVEKQQIPDHLIASFSRNLFADERSADTEHPAEALEKLLRNVSECGVSQDGVQIKMKGGKVKRASA